MPGLDINRLGKPKQIIYSVLLVILVSGICFAFGNYIDYKITSFILLLTVSVLAVLFDIAAVLIAAILSALIWNFFFIEPKYTFRIDSLEDGVLFSMYFVVAIINGILTYKIKQIEKQARQKEEKAKAIHLYNTLFNTLSHELKTPVAAIIGAADNLKGDNKNLTEENKGQLVNEISVAALRLNQQVNNLLNMSRIESGSMQLKKDWVDINELVHSVTNRLEENLKNHNINISLEKNLPLYKLDFVLMEQVLYNIIYNASIYTQEHSDISISAKNLCSKKYSINNNEEEPSSLSNEINYLLLIVEDSGNGFPVNEIDKVFDKFYRLADAKSGGTGLGLSIVKGFTEAHGGTVALENIPHGARFTLKIPAEVSYMNNLKNE